MRRLIFTGILLSTIGSLNLLAALPPMSEQDLIRDASHIVEGEVYDIDEQVVDAGHGCQNTQYRVKLMVTKIIKGHGIQSGHEIDVQYWRMKSRPNGWSGDSGQHEKVKRLTTIRAYLSKSDDQSYSLLEPNGFIKIKN